MAARGHLRERVPAAGRRPAQPLEDRGHLVPAGIRARNADRLALWDPADNANFVSVWHDTGSGVTVSFRVGHGWSSSDRCKDGVEHRQSGKPAGKPWSTASSFAFKNKNSTATRTVDNGVHHCERPATRGSCPCAPADEWPYGVPTGRRKHPREIGHTAQSGTTSSRSGILEPGDARCPFHSYGRWCIAFAAHLERLASRLSWKQFYSPRLLESYCKPKPNFDGRYSGAIRTQLLSEIPPLVKERKDLPSTLPARRRRAHAAPTNTKGPAQHRLGGNSGCHPAHPPAPNRLSAGSRRSARTVEVSDEKWSHFACQHALQDESTCLRLQLLQVPSPFKGAGHLLCDSPPDSLRQKRGSAGSERVLRFSAGVALRTVQISSLP